MNLTNSENTLEQQAKIGEAMLERKIGQQRASNAQFYAAMFVLLLACGLAFGAVADSSNSEADTVAKKEQREEHGEEQRDELAKSSRFCIFGVDDLKLRPSAARGENEKRSPAHFENGDCWIDKPGQMA